MSILNLTSKCIFQIIKRCKPNEMLRVSIDSGGCSGFTYLYSIDNKINKDDIVIEKNSAKIVVDEISVDYLKGAEIDYNDDLIRSGFIIEKNPNADTSCSCKVSFSLK